MANKLLLDVDPVCGDWADALPDFAEQAERAAQLVFRSYWDDISPNWANPDGEICLRLSDDAEVQRLNRMFRGQDKPTNVLSFPAFDEDEPLPQINPQPLGDIILAFETVKCEAEEQGKSFSDHFNHLVVHGTLHLLGFDHEDDEEAHQMEHWETCILKELNIADPYADD
ncbi:MAG: rRNA maturation RNase YbeY [Magnetovibrionaceae bacterium]